MPYDIAYIDPGSGSLIIQVVIATLIAIPVFFRTQLARLAGVARGRKEAPAATDDVADRD